MIAVIADTHMPKGARRLPERCVELLREAEAVLHAGDFIRVEVLRELEAIAEPGPGVHGNVDEAELRRLLPETLEIQLGAHRVAMIHDAGPAKGRLPRMRRRFPEADAVVFGHSHLPLHEARKEAATGRAPSRSSTPAARPSAAAPHAARWASSTPAARRCSSSTSGSSSSVSPVASVSHSDVRTLRPIS